MDYQVQLNNGQLLKLKEVENFNATEFTKTLNDRSIQFVNLGGAIINKGIIISITQVPVTETIDAA